MLSRPEIYYIHYLPSNITINITNMQEQILLNRELGEIYLNTSQSNFFTIQLLTN